MSRSPTRKRGDAMEETQRRNEMRFQPRINKYYAARTFDNTTYNHNPQNYKNQVARFPELSPNVLAQKLKDEGVNEFLKYNTSQVQKILEQQRTVDDEEQYQLKLLHSQRIAQIKDEWNEMETVLFNKKRNIDDKIRVGHTQLIDYYATKEESIANHENECKTLQRDLIRTKLEIEALKSGKSTHKIRYPSTGRRGKTPKPRLPKADFESEAPEGLQRSSSFTKQKSFLDNVRTITTNEVQTSIAVTWESSTLTDWILQQDASSVIDWRPGTFDVTTDMEGFARHITPVEERVSLFDLSVTTIIIDDLQPKEKIMAPRREIKKPQKSSIETQTEEDYPTIITPTSQSMRSSDMTSEEILNVPAKQRGSIFSQISNKQKSKPKKQEYRRPSMIGDVEFILREERKITRFVSNEESYTLSEPLNENEKESMTKIQKINLPAEPSSVSSSSSDISLTTSHASSARTSQDTNRSREAIKVLLNRQKSPVESFNTASFNSPQQSPRESRQVPIQPSKSPPPDTFARRISSKPGPRTPIKTPDDYNESNVRRSISMRSSRGNKRSILR